MALSITLFIVLLILTWMSRMDSADENYNTEHRITMLHDRTNNRIDIINRDLREHDKKIQELEDILKQMEDDGR